MPKRSERLEREAGKEALRIFNQIQRGVQLSPLHPLDGVSPSLFDTFFRFALRERKRALRECAAQFMCKDITYWKPREVVKIILALTKESKP